MKKGQRNIDTVEMPLTPESSPGRPPSSIAACMSTTSLAESEPGYPDGRELLRQYGSRTMLAVPLLREGVPIGVIVLFRTEVEPFSDKQVELLKTFADQAVIAIENVRLFTELEARNRDLTEALEQQTATSEILRVISQLADRRPAGIRHHRRERGEACDAELSVVSRIDGELIQLVASHGVSADGRESVGRQFPSPGRRDRDGAHHSTPCRRAYPRRPGRPDYESEGRGLGRGYRTCLGVPMLRDGRADRRRSSSARPKPGPFTDSRSQLLKTFADQAVIAIENVRLFKELEARNATDRGAGAADGDQRDPARDQRVADGRPAGVRRHRRARGETVRAPTSAVVSTFDGELSSSRRCTGYSREAREASRARRSRCRSTRDAITARAISTRASPTSRTCSRTRNTSSSDFARATGYRSGLRCPCSATATSDRSDQRRPGEPGHVRRTQIELLQTFADQAVIAIENVRLFTELETRNRDLTEALEQQTATSEILRVISQSPTDVQPVFETIAESAAPSCAAPASRASSTSMAS